MNSEMSQDEKLAKYRLHSELADRLSQRLDGNNKLYFGLYIGLAAFFAAALQAGIERLFLSRMVGLVGIFLLLPWYLLSRYIRIDHRAKIDTLIELDEGKLTKSFYIRERELLGARRFTRSDLMVDIVENYHLLVLLLLCALLIAASFILPTGQ